jgi:hypothetical protein
LTVGVKRRVICPEFEDVSHFPVIVQRFQWHLRDCLQVVLGESIELDTLPFSYAL